MLDNLLLDIRANSNKEKAEVLQRFFKTGIGQYGEGDIFHGIVVPIQRTLVKKYFKQINIEQIKILLNSDFHEERLVGALILVAKFENSKDINEREKVYNFYLENSLRINNWDLVDLSAPNIVGNFLLDKNRNILYKLVLSDNLWQRRISILATFAFIKSGDFDDSISIIMILLNDKEDLIHKACGWMLREIGKRDKKVLVNFLDVNITKLPRTTLRYAIEKFPEDIRRQYLSIKKLK